MEAPNFTTNNNYFFQLGHNNNVVFHFEKSHEPDHGQYIKMSSRQAIYAFIVTVLLNMVQIKYQSKHDSPVETRPKTVSVALLGLLAYYILSYYAIATAEPRRRRRTVFAALIEHLRKFGLRFSGSLSLGSIISVLLPESLSPLVFSLSFFFSFSKLLPKSYVKTSWDKVKKVATYIMEHFLRKPGHHIMRRSGVYVPQQQASGVEMLQV